MLFNLNLFTKVTMLNVVMYSIGGLTIALCAAAIFVLAFELPFTRVEKILVCSGMFYMKWCSGWTSADMDHGRFKQTSGPGSDIRET